MSDQKYRIVTEILTNSASFKAGMRESGTAVRRFAASAKSEIESLKNTWRSWVTKAAAVGLGFGGLKLLKETAAVDKRIMGIGISAGKSAGEINDLKDQLDRLAISTGRGTDSVADGFEKILSLTGSWDIARKAIESVNGAVKVTGANSDLLSESLAVAQTSFGLNLSEPGAAQGVLNKLAGIGIGAGGMGNVAGIFNSVAPLAQLAGMNFDDTIKLISAISNVTKNPEQMGSYAEQTLRLFTNMKTITNKKSQLGGLLFDKNDERRAPLEVIQKIKEMYDSLGEKKRICLLTAITGGADAKSLKAIELLLASSALKNIKTPVAMDLERKLPEVLNNAEDQALRLKELLGNAGEEFARPINKAISDFIRLHLDKVTSTVENSGILAKDVVVGGTIAFLTAAIGGKLAKGALGDFVSGKTGLVGGIWQGKALQAATGVTPVYVVNFSEANGWGGNKTKNAVDKILTKVPLAAAVTGLAVPALATALVGGGLYGAFRINRENISSRGIYHPPRELTDAEKYPLFANSPAPEFNENGIKMPKIEPVISIFIDGEKKRPAKTIVDNRGRF